MLLNLIGSIGSIIKYRLSSQMPITISFLKSDDRSWKLHTGDYGSWKLPTGDS